MARRATEHDKNLGIALAAVRRAADLTQTELGKRMERSQAWVSRAEDGTHPPTPNEIDLILNQCKPPEQLRRTIEELRTPPPAGALRASRVDPKFMDLTRLEQAALEIFVFTSERMPTSLQSDQFLLKQYRRAKYDVTEADLLVERGRRQQVFTGRNPRPYNVLLSESALYQMPGGQLDLVREQASYLIDLDENFDRLRLQVLRFGADLPFVESDMVILRCPGKPRLKAFFPYGPSVGNVTGSDVSACMEYWQEAQAAALSVDETRKFLHHLSENGYRPTQV